MTCERCLCSKCHPTGAPMQCSSCGEEVRLGYRDGQKGFWHRENVDHATIHGHRLTYADQEAYERFRREHRWTAEDGSTYTTAEWEISKDKDTARRKRRLAELRGEDPDAPPPPLPAPEIPRHDVKVEDFDSRSGIVQVYNLLAGITRLTPAGKSSKSLKHPPMAPGWEVVRFTHSKGPYLGSGGEVLSISDKIVIGARGPEVDGRRAIAVASWRDGDFDTAYVGWLKDHVARVDPVNATEFKSWIKEPT